MAPSSSGELPRTAKPKSSSLWRTSASASAFKTSAFNRAMMFLRRAAGARIANQELKAKPGSPDSEMVGTLGNCDQSFLRAHPDQPELTSAHQRRDRSQALEADRI